jgi:glycosyltransferase involved in cell wall biosynthesis
MVTIAIPSYNQERTIDEAIVSAIMQDYPDKEILVIDDASTDNTAYLINWFDVRLIRNVTNLGIGCNLTKCMNEAKGDYLIYLCGDDFFAHASVVSDMVKIFKDNFRVGVIDRNYYQFINGHKGAVGAVREENILVSSVNPSGMGFRKSAMNGEFSNKIFIEMPSMVNNVLNDGWSYYKLNYDTVAVRLHANNTCVNSSYYNDSPTKSFATMVPNYICYGVLITLKNRCPERLLKEMLEIIKRKPLCLLSLNFWACSLLAIMLPRVALTKLSNFYRHRIQRNFCSIKQRRCNRVR